jgi:putative ABC transport system ATP-binding protein
MLEIRHLHKAFSAGGLAPKVALRDVNLTIPTGAFVTIIGSNGAGKSTLLNAVAGVFAVDKGCIMLNGKDITFLPEHRRAAFIGRVFQNPLQGTAASMTVEENLVMAWRRGQCRGLRRGITANLRRHIRDRLCQLGLGLEDRLHTAVGFLSGGQRQALTLLMATMTRPELLLLDEHVAALDPNTAQQILHLTEKMVAEEGLTTLMVTHNMEHALRMGDTTIMMHEGEIVLNVKGTKRAAMTVHDLLNQFKRIRGEQLLDDRMLLAD